MREPSQIPFLRSDVSFQLVAERGGKMPSVVINDPIQGKYYKLFWPESGVFLCLKECITVEQLTSLAQSRFGIVVTAELLRELLEFVHGNQLTQLDEAGTWHRFDKAHRAGKQNHFMRAFKAYMFLRVPLLRPQAGLEYALPWLRWVFSAQFWFFITILTGVLVWLASRQSDALLRSGQAVFDMQGFGAYALALLILKFFHELGHALTAVRHGTKVPSLGVAFMFGAPVLYTDTSDSWRLADKKKRIQIVFGGVAAEIIVAVICLGLWVFLPDSSLRTLCFAFATTTLVMSLFVNLNPFMRFDGYFALSDAIDVPNLQARAFALGAWQLKSWLLGARSAAPERFGGWKQRVLIGYAYLTWTYRVFMFLGIAALLIYSLGKAVGGILALIEIWMFLFLPVVKEITTWRDAIVQWKRNLLRLVVSLVAVAIALAVFFSPWISRISVPAVHMASFESQIYAPMSAKLKKLYVEEGQRVEKNQLVAVLHSSRAEVDVRKKEAEVEFLRQELRASESLQMKTKSKQSLAERVRQVESELHKLRDAVSELDLRAPVAGVVRDIDESCTKEQWVSAKKPILNIVGDIGSRVVALMPEAQTPRVSAEIKGRFMPDNALGNWIVTNVGSENLTAVEEIPELVLADQFGGSVQVSNASGILKPSAGWMEIHLSSSAPSPTHIVRGHLTIAVEPLSPARLLWMRLASVLVREQVM
jgi:putative peptide zinc metalloprotease protein